MQRRLRPSRALLGCVLISQLAVCACATPDPRAHLQAGDVAAAMQVGLAADATDADVSAFSRQIFGLMDLEIELQVQDAQTIERELHGSIEEVLRGGVPLRVSWSAREVGPLVLDVTEPAPVFELSGRYGHTGQLVPAFPSDLATAAGEGEQLRALEAELAATESVGPGASDPDRRRRCTLGERGEFSICLLQRTLAASDVAMASPREVREHTARFLAANERRLPRSNALHERLYGSRTEQLAHETLGSRAAVLTPYSRAQQNGADGTAVTISVHCVSCDGFPHPGRVTAVVFVPLSVWEPGAGRVRVWPPPPEAQVHYSGAAPTVL